MGYDMRWVRVPNDEQVAVSATRDELLAARRDRDRSFPHSAEWRDALKRIDAAQRKLWCQEVSYFRLNIWGMSEAREELLLTGMVTSDYSIDPNAPLDVEAVIPGLAGIPVHKLGSNDGWVVQPSEIRSGIHAADDKRPGWRDSLCRSTLSFVVWMTKASHHDGFVVW